MHAAVVERDGALVIVLQRVAQDAQQRSEPGGRAREDQGLVRLSHIEAGAGWPPEPYMFPDLYRVAEPRTQQSYP